MFLWASKHCCGIIIVVCCLEGQETTSPNLPIPDDGILPYAAIAPRDQDRMAAMRPALKYCAPKPHQTGLLPRVWEEYFM